MNNEEEEDEEEEPVPYSCWGEAECGVSVREEPLRSAEELLLREARDGPV